MCSPSVLPPICFQLCSRQCPCRSRCCIPVPAACLRRSDAAGGAGVLRRPTRCPGAPAAMRKPLHPIQTMRPAQTALASGHPRAPLGAPRPLYQIHSSCGPQAPACRGRCGPRPSIRRRTRLHAAANKRQTARRLVAGTGGRRPARTLACGRAPACAAAAAPLLHEWPPAARAAAAVHFPVTLQLFQIRGLAAVVCRGRVCARQRGGARRGGGSRGVSSRMACLSTAGVQWVAIRRAARMWQQSSRSIARRACRRVAAPHRA